MHVYGDLGLHMSVFPVQDVLLFHLPRSVWSHQVLNLQGNPWNCSCPLLTIIGQIDAANVTMGSSFHHSFKCWLTCDPFWELMSQLQQFENYKHCSKKERNTNTVHECAEDT